MKYGKNKSASGSILGLFTKHAILIASLNVIGIGILLLALFGMFAAIDEDGCPTDDEGTPGVSIQAGTGGEWTKEGTKAYNRAKAIFDYWTKKRGFSGAGAAGVVGNTGNESGYEFEPFIYQGGGLRYDPENISGAVGTNGYGIYQVSPGNRYGKWSGYKKTHDDMQAIVNQSDYIWEGYGMAKFSNGLMTAPKVYRRIAMARTPEQGTFEWYYNVENAQGSINGYDQKAKRESIARKAYVMFGGEKIEANSALFGVTAGSTVSAANAEEGECLGINGGDGGILDYAKGLLGYFHYELVHGIHYIGNVDAPDKDGVTDCSGFIWLVLAKAGYKVPDDMQWFTQTMENDAKSGHKWLQEVSQEEAGPGDIVIVNTGNGSGANGHTAFLEENWKGDDTKIIQMGGIPGRGVNEDKFGTSFMSLIQGKHSLTFARPVKK